MAMTTRLLCVLLAACAVGSPTVDATQAAA